MLLNALSPAKALVQVIVATMTKDSVIIRRSERSIDISPLVKSFKTILCDRQSLLKRLIINIRPSMFYVLGKTFERSRDSDQEEG